MKPWYPDDGAGSDPLWGGLFSRRGDVIASVVVLAIIVGVWLVLGAAWGGGIALLAVVVWGWIGF